MYQFALFSKNEPISRLLISELCAVARSAGLNGLLKEILGLAPQAQKDIYFAARETGGSALSPALRA